MRWFWYFVSFVACVGYEVGEPSHSVVLSESAGRPAVTVAWFEEPDHLVFEVVASTLGYVALGFSATGRMEGSDFLVTWVDSLGFGHAEDRFGFRGQVEPVLDEQQDWILVSSKENATHTSVRARRKKETCDPQDWTFSSDTVRILWAIHDADPDLVPIARNVSHPFLGSIKAHRNKLAYHGFYNKGAVSVFLLQNAAKPTSAWKSSPSGQLTPWEALNQNVSLPGDVDTLYWCQILRPPSPPEKKSKWHMVGYEPLIQPGHEALVHHMILYECSPQALRYLSHQQLGHPCPEPNMPDPSLACKKVVAAWAVGSQGLALPADVGYAVHHDASFLLETHYDNRWTIDGIVDSSGLTVWLTDQLREREAGVLTLGIDPSWQHIIPPGQEQVVSFGHCPSDCTRDGFPAEGIQVFAVLLHAHLLAEGIRVRYIRNETLSNEPIAADYSYDFNFQEYRRLDPPQRFLKGDRFVVECSYRSSRRREPTLGGLSTRHEMCLAFLYHVPKIYLNLCCSTPSVENVLESVGVAALHPGTRTIASPGYLEGRSLDEYMKELDWSKQADSFQRISARGPVNGICWLNGRPREIPGLYPPPMLIQEEINRTQTPHFCETVPGNRFQRRSSLGSFYPTSLTSSATAIGSSACLLDLLGLLGPLILDLRL